MYNLLFLMYSTFSNINLYIPLFSVKQFMNLQSIQVLYIVPLGTQAINSIMSECVQIEVILLVSASIVARHLVSSICSGRGCLRRVDTEVIESSQF